MSNKEFPSVAAKARLKRIQDRRRAMANEPSQRTKYGADEYEQDVSKLLTDLFPFSVLSGIRLFSASMRQERDFGFEIDNLLHVRLGGTDHILVVEAKKPKINVQRNGKWIVEYAEGPKCAKEQVDNHIKTLWEYLAPIAAGVDLRFVAVVCSLEVRAAPSRSDGFHNADLNVIDVDSLVPFLQEKFLFGESGDEMQPEVLRVSQSPFLSILRLSLPVQQLGHPELTSAVRYVERCRRVHDGSLFSDFLPKPDRWAINGSAGMGKSVLLAYSAVVFASGRELDRFQGDEIAKPTTLLEKLDLSSEGFNGPIRLMAMTVKQLQQLRKFYADFVARFQSVDYQGDVRFKRVEFVLCPPVASELAEICSQTSVLLVDEAHDLPDYAVKVISERHKECNFYLVLAYDPHQKLSLSRNGSRVMEGIDFTLKTRRLRQVYRNPAPVYLASLAIMFRWAAVEPDGPKVIPDKNQLDKEFSLQSETVAEGTRVSIKTDAHPANAWYHTVASFPDAKTAFEALTKEGLGHSEVLWVRFSPEERHFDYEKLHRFTYHNCRNHESHLMHDKYVKGQEYPVVVIEGFPGFMDRHKDGEAGPADERKMWRFRREVYLCASRATCFLYFICNPHPLEEEHKRIKAEIDELIRSVAIPSDTSQGTRLWSMVIKRSSRELRTIDLENVFGGATATPDHGQHPKSALLPPDSMEAPELVEPKPPVLTIDAAGLPQPVTVGVLAEALGLKTYQIVADLMAMKVFATTKHRLTHSQVKAVCQKHGIAYQTDETSSVDDESVGASLSASSEDPKSPYSTQSQVAAEHGANLHPLVVSGPISVMRLADLLGVQQREVIIDVKRLGYNVTGASRIAGWIAEKVASGYGFKIVAG